jgi:group I intron endonuclease
MKNVIYIIRNTINSRLYIGSAVKFNVRKNQHLHHLKRGTHHNPPLQNFVNKYGIDKIYFEILEICNYDNLIKREQYYIDNMNPYFNVNKIAQSPKGLKRTPEQIKNIIEGRLKNGGYKKGYKLPKNVVNKIKKTRLKNGGYIVTEKMKKSISKANKGKVMTESARKKISKKLKGRKLSKEHKEKLSKSLVGNKNWKNIDYTNPIRNKKISEATKKRKSKKVLNVKTGVYYNSAKDAADSIGMPRSTFAKHLSGYNKTNKTDFIYVH